MIGVQVMRRSAALAFGFALVACGQHADSERTGTLSMELATQVGGVSYRLRDAQFAVAGPESLSLSSETAPDAAAIDQQLDAGDYSIELLSGWRLERQSSMGYQTVLASLASTNPVTFSIGAGHETNVGYAFLTDGRVVGIGKGNLHLTISVTDTSTGSSCGNGVVETGEVCDDGNTSNIDMCSTSCTLCTQAAGPELTTAIGGWPDSGLQLTAIANSTLYQFTFQNQGKADVITLRTTAGTVIGTVNVPAGQPNFVANVNWALDGGATYTLTNQDSANGYWVGFSSFPVQSGALRVDGTFGNGALQTSYWFSFLGLASCAR
ncbi:MAG: hypothetical protein ACOY0T_21055 [Myxococcota bacterium]